MRAATLSFLLLAGCAGVRPRRVEFDPGQVWEFLSARYDADHDGHVRSSEYTRGAEAFRRLDADGDGVVTRLDFAPEFDGRPRGPWKDFSEFVYGEGGPEVGDPAPSIALESTTGERIELAAFRGQKPVVLVFGSFT